ncbi:bactofilin family protein [Comamonas sp. 4034]|uniref:bactofilin family protein n=1 Tax=Comamonas sp. 4034 TaxID=3156455 RepID=UPI003D1D52DF
MSEVPHSWLFGVTWLLVTAAVFLIPLYPALRELYSRSDAGALEIDHLDNGRTDYAALRMLDQLPVLEEMPRTAQWQQDDRGQLVIPRGQTRLMAKTMRSVVLGFRAQIKALVSSDTVELQANSMVLHFLHANNIHCLGPVHLARLSSAVRNIVLSPGSRFQRLSATCIFTWPLKRSLGFPLDSLGDGMPLTVVQQRHHGDLQIPAGTVVQGGLVVTGNLRVEEMAVVTGHVKVHGSVTLAKGACVKGALFALDNIDTLGNNYIEGPLCAGKHLQLGPNSQVGSKQVPCSVSAWTIALLASVRVYGSMSAVRSGQVVL